MKAFTIYALPGGEALASGLAEGLGANCGTLETRRFPDGESYVRLLTSAQGKDVAFVASLDRPDDKTLPLLFAARAARETGATSVGLVAPYLPYMRQDCRFNEGEAVTSRQFAELLSECFDWLVTVDPHLHRWKSLAEIYKIPTTVVHAAPMIAAWISDTVARPLVIGPDEESEQWVTEIAAKSNFDYLVLKKRRLGDFEVEIEIPDMAQWLGRTPVIVDDVISTARTMIRVTKLLQTSDMVSPVCVGVHGVFFEGAYPALQAAGAAQIATCNTVMHESNTIDISGALMPAILTHVYPLKMLR